MNEEIQLSIPITGGVDFIGSHPCEELLNPRHEAICLADFYAGSQRNIAHLVGYAYFENIRHDVMLPMFVEVDHKHNLACPASPIHYQDDPVQTTEVSAHGAINMLGLAKCLSRQE